ncbi:MAG: hypothetical protein AAGM22_24755 [Acidobacteriota bacterium]
METPRVNAVGLVEYPEDYVASPRTYSRALKLGALLFLSFFAAVTVISTVVSLGAYCLTSDGGDTRSLRSSPLVKAVAIRDPAAEAGGLDVHAGASPASPAEPPTGDDGVR